MFSPGRVTSGGPISATYTVAIGQHSFEDTSRLCRAVGGPVSDFTRMGLEPRPRMPMAKSLSTTITTQIFHFSFFTRKNLIQPFLHFSHFSRLFFHDVRPAFLKPWVAPQSGSPRLYKWVADTSRGFKYIAYICLVDRHNFLTFVFLKVRQ